MASLTVEGVSKSFGEVSVLKNVSFRAEQGDFLALVGPSGCGKTTLLNVIAGLDRSDSGIIRIGDRVITGVHPKDRDIAMVFQSYALYPNMTVRGNISFGMEVRKVPTAERAREVERVAKLMQIEELLDRKPAQLSGGQRQRVAMARALVRDPKVFLFDEPLSSLDAKLRLELRMEIKHLHQRLGVTIVYVTHDQIEAMTLASRIVVMKDGEIQQIADPRTIYEEPANVFVAGFIGVPTMNFVPAMVARIGSALGLVIATAEGPITLSLPTTNAVAEPWLGRQVILGLRPEHISHRRESEVNDGFHAAFDRRIDAIEPTGADTMTFMTLGETEVVARIRPDRVAAPGQVMHLMADMSKACLFDPDTLRRIGS